jgi:hypothetical protein
LYTAAIVKWEEKKMFIFDKRRNSVSGQLTLGGDWRREIFLVDGTGLASEMGRVLGRGGLELEGALLYLNKDERKFAQRKKV